MLDCNARLRLLLRLELKVEIFQFTSDVTGQNPGFEFVREFALLLDRRKTAGQPLLSVRGRRFLSGASRLVDHTLGGWAIAGITTLSPGDRVNVSVQGNPSNNGQTDRPNMISVLAPVYDSLGDVVAVAEAVAQEKPNPRENVK